LSVLIAMLLLLLHAVVCTTQTYTSQCSNKPGSEYCIYGGPSSDGRVVVTIHSSAKGWVGFGVGSSMTRAMLYVCWKDSKDQLIIVQSQTTKDAYPSPTNIQQVQLLPNQITTPQWATFAYSFVIAQQQNTSTYLMATSNQRPYKDIDTIYALYKEHDQDHVFKANFDNLIQGTPLIINANLLTTTTPLANTTLTQNVFIGPSNAAFTGPSNGSESVAIFVLQLLLLMVL
jgi:hypothetical protein